MLEAGQKVERYCVERLLGEGGMAVVYLARHETLDTLHAIKVLTLTGPSLQQRLVAEGRIQAGLRHRNIVRVSDVLDVQGMPALVLDFVDGPDLHEWIVRNKPSAAEAEAMFRGIVAGVRAAHEAGVVHRDLKPANVLVAHEGGQSVPKVADFGLVKALQGESQSWKTRSGLPMGTPAYMPPEQIRDAANVDERADIFALGCILYELIAHQPAYYGDDLMEIFERVRAGERAPLPPDTPAALRATVEACLQLDPAHRPATCDALLARLEEAALPTIPMAATTPVQHVAQRPTVSRSAVAAGGAGLAALLVAGLLGVFVVGAMAWLLGGADPDAPCPTSGGQLGWVRAPMLFSKHEGATWRVPRDTTVLEAVPTDDTPDPDPICKIPSGSTLTLVSEPVRAGGIWVEVHGRALVLAEPDPEEEDAMEPDEDSVEEEDPEELPEPAPPPSGCPDVSRGEVIGYANPRPFVLPKGSVWRVNVAKTLYSDYPRSANDFTIGPQHTVCVLPAGTNVMLDAAPITVRRQGRWVPVLGGSIQ